MITLRNLSLRRGPKVVLQGATATVTPGEKVGLVGRNGAGKSSLFALLTNELHADAGDFDMPPAWLLPGGISQVSQSMPETDESATDFVMAGDTRLLGALQAIAAAEQGHDGMAIAHAHQAMDEAGGFTAQSRAQALILGLGFKPEELELPVNSFSGGWRMRLQLARALMCPAQLMLLDEPTNHLDLDALVWLEGFLTRFEGTMLVISHDREFLDAVTRVTLHLEDATLTRYAGNYSKFEEMKAERERLQQASHSRQQERIAHLTRFVERFKAKASKARQAQSRIKALERMERIPPVLSAASFDFEFKEPANVPNPMLAVSGLACGYSIEGQQKAILTNLDRSIMAGQRIGLLGANGQGKSTLVKTIAQALPPLAGEYIQGKGLSIGYFAQQELDVLRESDTPMQHLQRLARETGPAGREQELRNFLGSFRFTNEMAAQAVGTMSGDEKARLVLAMLVWQRPNLLLLDEPTNHLDLVTREALAMALNGFEGALLLVSHDRALLRSVCDEFWLVTDGRLAPFDGDLDDYQRWLLERAKVEQKAAQKAQRESVQSARKASNRRQQDVASALARQS
ncbi:MAG: ATP-binding cassette domain-containing protein [Lautropia sp.]|nr:ATP-binding cassette domain-containing protein [Lautropia sp.]